MTTPQPEPIYLKPSLVETPELLPDLPVVDIRQKNELNITKVTSVTLLTFDIKIIRVSPSSCCSIDIVINTSTGHQERTVNLTADDYTKWGTDDNYLYYYIRDNIDKIY